MNEYITLVERDETPLWVSIAMSAFGDAAALQATAAIEFQLQKYRFLGSVHQVERGELAELTHLIEEQYKAKGPAYFEWYARTCRKLCSALYDTAMDLSRLPAFPDQRETARRMAIYFEAAHQCAPYLLTIFPVQHLLQERLKAVIAPFFESTDINIDTALALLCSPVEPTAVEQDSRSAHVLLELIKNNEKLTQAVRDGEISTIRKLFPDFYIRLDDHCRKFGWLRTYTFRNRPYTAGDLLSRLQDRLWRLERRLADDNSEPSRPDTAEEDLAEVLAIAKDVPTEVANVVKLAREYANLRFYRVDVHFMSAAAIISLLDTVAEDLGMTFDLLPYLTCSEILKGLEERTNSLCDISLERKQQGFDVVLQSDHTLRVSSPTTFRIGQAAAPPIIEGTSACLGTWTGRVRIVRSLEDCVDFERGDVLVSPMTTPEFMPAIDRAGALVTDEGGILCHAAIISRELNIPCVIGTGNASHVLQSGEFVKVAATPARGTVTRQGF